MLWLVSVPFCKFQSDYFYCLWVVCIMQYELHIVVCPLNNRLWNFHICTLEVSLLFSLFVCHQLLFSSEGQFDACSSVPQWFPSFQNIPNCATFYTWCFWNASYGMLFFYRQISELHGGLLFLTVDTKLKLRVDIQDYLINKCLSLQDAHG